MDFPINSKVFNMLKDFDKIVIDCKGHIYMAKDARISKDVFSDIYKDSIKTIMSLKDKYDKDLKLKSMM
ncbi:MAG: FAD-binding oxidoreductase, partial [Thermoplasmata archaeon]